jgi:hypothetical protein
MGMLGPEISISLGSPGILLTDGSIITIKEESVGKISSCRVI